MSGTHAHALTVHGHGPIHRLPAHVKLVSMVAFLLAVVATPPRQVWAFGVYAGLVIGVLTFSEVPFGHFLRRMTIETPFVLFAVALPFLGSGPRTEFLGLTVSSEGLVAAWNIVAKATLGVAASVLLVSTTEIPHILDGLRRLRAPRVMVAVAGFMVRYIEVIADELKRMRRAMSARGYEPTWLGQTRALATAGGALFIRSYERGERVHQAMVARGFSGAMPETSQQRPDPMVWPIGLSVPAAAWMITLSAWLA